MKHTAHNLRTPKHEGLYRYGRRCGRHNLLLHKPLIGGMVQLLFNTTRAHTPDPQAREKCSTELVAPSDEPLDESV